MKPFEVRNAHFDRLVNTPGLRWMGQNTNHATPHPAVLAAMEKCTVDYHATVKDVWAVALQVLN